MHRLIPKAYIVFKKIFGVEENKDLLISLINSIVSDEDQIVDITLLDPYDKRNLANQKLSASYVKAKSVTGKMLNIEIQLTYSLDYDKEGLYGCAKFYKQLYQNKSLSSFSKTICIHMLYFTTIQNSPKYHHRFQLKEESTSIVFSNDLEIHTIELDKFPQEEEKIFMTTDERLKALLPKIKTPLDRWLLFLNESYLLDEDNLPQELNDPNFKKAIDVLNITYLNKIEREIYEDHVKWLMDVGSALEKKAERKTETIEQGEIEIAMIETGQDIEYMRKIT